MPIENEIVDASIDTEAIEVQRPSIVVIGRGPTKLEVECCVWTCPASNLV